MESEKRIGPPMELQHRLLRGLEEAEVVLPTILAKGTPDFLLPQILSKYFSPYLSEPTAAL